MKAKFKKLWVRISQTFYNLKGKSRVLWVHTKNKGTLIVTNLKERFKNLFKQIKNRIFQTALTIKDKSKQLWDQTRNRVFQTALTIKELYKRNKTDILWTIVLLLVTWMWFGISSECHSWFDAYNKKKLWVTKLYILMDKNTLFNVPICFFLFRGFYLWCKKIWKDKDFRIFRFPIIISSILIIYDSSKYVYYAKIWHGIDYGQFVMFLLVLALLVMLAKGIFYLFKKNKNQPTTKTNSNYVSRGFTNDDTDKTDIPENLKIYVSTIVEKLMETQIDNHSFAIGITGEWGSGKTTILEAIEKKIKEIKDKTDIVKFNPWMCRTPEQVTHDFFASLRHQLSKKHSTLSKSINEYAEIINELTIQPHSVLGFQVPSFNKKKSLFETKKELSEKFKKLPNPIVVFIDDLDRLERDEVFEVLRLIRNTGDLSNVIYIAAFDKEYVSCILEDKNIKDATSYLEKIFQVEIPLPKVDDFSIWKTLLKDLSEQDYSYNKIISEWVDNTFKNDDRELIIRVLGNYRRVNRFARIFMLNLNYGYNNEKLRNELNKEDLFWLVLLQMYDMRTYVKLKNEPYCLLYFDNNKYKLKKGILFDNAVKNDRQSISCEPFWDKETPEILDRLFNSRNNLYIKILEEKGLRYYENYNKYFSLSVSPFKLSFSEINGLFSNEANAEKLVDTWIQNKYSNSILFQFNQINIDIIKNDKNKLKVFIEAILFYGMKSNTTSQIKNLLQENLFQGQETKEFVSELVYSWIEKKVEESNTLKNLSYLLNSLYLTTSYDSDGHEIENQPLVITNDKIEETLLKIMTLYLNKHPELTAIDIMKEKGEFPEIFANCCVNDIYDARCGDPEGRSFKQIAFDLVIHHFETKESKPSITEYESAYKELFAIKDVEDEEYYYAVEEHDYKMLERFGNSFEKKLNEFKQRCFSTDPKVQESAN